MLSNAIYLKYGYFVIHILEVGLIIGRKKNKINAI